MTIKNYMINKGIELKELEERIKILKEELQN